MLLSLIGAAVVAAMAAVWSLNSGQRHEMTCTGLRVEIADDYDMVTQAEVEHFLRNDYGPYIGQRLDSVNLDRIERILDGKGASSRQRHTRPKTAFSISWSPRGGRW